jgi:hypothetical protein
MAKLDDAKSWQLSACRTFGARSFSHTEIVALSSSKIVTSAALRGFVFCHSVDGGHPIRFRFVAC